MSDAVQPPPPLMPAVARILSRYDRAKLASFVTVAIDLIDVLDGDPDSDRCEAADDTGSQWSDSDGQPGDPTDAEYAWSEWHTRGRRKVSDYGEGCQGHRLPCHEDAEDDDPLEDDDHGGGNVTDEPHDGDEGV